MHGTATTISFANIVRSRHIICKEQSHWKDAGIADAETYYRVRRRFIDSDVESKGSLNYQQLHRYLNAGEFITMVQ